MKDGAFPAVSAESGKKEKRALKVFFSILERNFEKNVDRRKFSEYNTYRCLTDKAGQQKEYGRLAQLVELSLDVRKVGDSSSSTSTNGKLLF